MSTRPPPCNT